MILNGVLFLYTCSDEYISKLEEETQVALSLGTGPVISTVFLYLAVSCYALEGKQLHPQIPKSLAQIFTSEGLFENTEVELNITIDLRS